MWVRQDPQIPQGLQDSQDSQSLQDLQGSQDSQSLQDRQGLQDLQGSQDLQAPQEPMYLYDKFILDGILSKFNHKFEQYKQLLTPNRNELRGYRYYLSES